MKAYVVINNWQCDSGECGLGCLGVYDTFEKAQKVFEKEMQTARIDFGYLETEEDEYKKGYRSWSIWEKEEYCYNHIDLKIIEKEIQ